MSRLLKLKLASRKSLACFLPSHMATAGTSTLFSSTDPEAPDDGHKPDGIKSAERGSNPKASGEKQKLSETKAGAAAAPPANLGREIVTYGVESKKEELPEAEVEEPEEILELKTPGFVRVFGCDNCADSDTDIRQDGHNSSSEVSEDESPHGSHLPSHLIPVVHLRVPMRNEDDIRKVVAALQIKGVLEVSCDLENQIVKVSGNADPDRLLKKVKKVKRKSKLISYSNPSAMPKSNLHSEIPLPTAPPPAAYVFVRPAFEERFRPPPPQPSHVFSRESHGLFGVPPPHVRPAPAQPRPFENEAFYTRPPPTAWPPPNVRHPAPAAFCGADSLHSDYYMPRPPSSPPHYSSSRSPLYSERRPRSLRRSTSPPRRRSYHHAPHFRPPPPPMRYAGGPAGHHQSSPWGPGVACCMDDYPQGPDRVYR